MNKILYILRGVSGSGKTTLAKNLCKLPNTFAVAADDYHYDDQGNYNWKAENLAVSHKWCKSQVELFMLDGYNVVLHNTNTTEKEINPYIELAEKYNYNIVSLVIENRHGNDSIHNVPQEVRLNQERKLRDNLRLI